MYRPVYNTFPPALSLHTDTVPIKHAIPQLNTSCIPIMSRALSHDNILVLRRNHSGSLMREAISRMLNQIRHCPWAGESDCYGMYTIG